MTDDRLTVWETLFQHALEILDQLPRHAELHKRWTFGGGTVLMRKYRHRFSKDIDIFVPDPQYLGYLTPRLNDVAASKTSNYAEHAGSLKLYFDQGEVDFVAAASLVTHPYDIETILGREVRVETAAEIIGKKVKHRCKEFKARDLFDLCLIAEREMAALEEIAPLINEAAPFILDRMQKSDVHLREDFAAIDTWEYRPTYDHCVASAKELFDRLGSQPSIA